MNKDRSVYFGVIRYFLAIAGLVFFVFLTRDITFPEDFMTIPERLPLENFIIGLVGAAIAFIATIFMSSPVKKV